MRGAARRRTLALLPDPAIPQERPVPKRTEAPLHVYRGDTCDWQFWLWLDDDRAEPADLDGATVRAQVRRDPDHRDAVDLAVAVGLPNLVMLHLSAEASVRCPSGRWDLELRWADGQVATVLAGPVTVSADVTRV
jgi:hypothetical protein